MLGEEDTEIEDEYLFYDVFGDLIYYVETRACNREEKENFKFIVDNLLVISSERKLDKIDVNYILFQKAVLEFLDKFKDKRITEKVLENQLFKIFELKDHDYLLKQLINRYKII